MGKIEKEMEITVRLFIAVSGRSDYYGHYAPIKITVASAYSDSGESA